MVNVGHNSQQLTKDRSMIIFDKQKNHHSLAKIVTNNQYRDLKCFHDIPSKHQADFDYVKDDDRHSARFFKYRNSWYDTHEFQYSAYLGKWNAAQCETYFSAIYIKYSYDYDAVIVGFAHW